MSAFPSIPSAAVVLPGLVPTATTNVELAPPSAGDFATLLASTPAAVASPPPATAPLNPPSISFHLTPSAPSTTDLQAGEPVSLSSAHRDDVPLAVPTDETPETVIPIELLAQAVVAPMPSVEVFQEQGRGAVTAQSLHAAPEPGPTDVSDAPHVAERNARVRSHAGREVPASAVTSCSPVVMTAEGAPAPVATLPATPTRSPSMPAGTPVEKTADASLTPPPVVSASAEQVGQNKFLTSAESRDANLPKPRGIAPANRLADMRHDLPNAAARSRAESVVTTVPSKAPSVQALSMQAGSEPQDRAAALPAPGTPPTPSPAAAFSAPTAESPVVSVRTLSASGSREAPSTAATEAAGVVREVVELTHEFRARERSSVEVDFSFKDNTHLSVRLALRDGAVHTTFRTESESLRAALSQEWHARVNESSRDATGVRLAEAIFTGASSHASSAVAPAPVSGPSADTSRHHSSNNPADPSRLDASTSGGGDSREHAHSSYTPSDSSAHHRGAASSARAFASPVHGTSMAIASADAAVRPAHDRAFQAFA